MRTPSTARDRIKLGCLHYGITQVALAAKIGTDKSEISHVASGRYLGGTVVDGVAKTLGCTIDWLVHGTGEAPSWASSDAGYIPNGTPQLALVGHTSAGDGEVFEPYDIPLAFPVLSDWVVVRVDGDSAYPVVYRGQFVVLDTRRTQCAKTLDLEAMNDLHDNMVMIRTVNGKSLLKRFCHVPESPEGFTLASVNAGLGSPWVARKDIETVTPVVGVIYEDPTKPRIKGRVLRPTGHKSVNPLMAPAQ